MGAGAEGGGGREEARAAQQCQEDMECPAQAERGLAAPALDALSARVYVHTSDRPDGPQIDLR